MVNFSIEGKVAIVTGGADGIGFEYVRKFLQKGAKGITILDVNRKAGLEATKKISEECGSSAKVLFVQADVSNYAQFEDGFKQTFSKFGQIDILINNAGIFNDTVWEKEIQVNLVGTINGMLLGQEHYIPKYKSGPEGVIVNISSIVALSGYGPNPVYTATKFGVHGLTISLGDERHYNRTKVRVIGIFPGCTTTNMIADLPKAAMNPEYVDESLREWVASLPKQTPEDVANHVTALIEKAAAGTMWVVEGNQEPYQYTMPDRFTIPHNPFYGEAMKQLTSPDGHLCCTYARSTTCDPQAR